MKRETIETGGVLTRRKAVVTVHEDAATAVAALDRLRTAPTLAEQIVRYFGELADRLRAIGFVVRPNFGLTPPPNFGRTHPDWSLSEEFSELRYALHEFVADAHGRPTPRLAPVAQLNAVARAFYAGRLAQERHLSQYEPDTERGIRDGRQREEARTVAGKAKRRKADIWRAKAVAVACSMVVPTKAYSASDVAGQVRRELSIWLPAEYERLGREFIPTRDVPSIRTIRLEISPSKIVGSNR